MENLNIAERARKILGNSKINILKDEKEVLKRIEKMSNNDGYTSEDIKFLDEIEEYLEEREKIIQKKDDMDFLKNLASNLREQEVRKTDNSNPPMFVIKNSSNENVFFISRNALNEYSNCNREAKEKAIEVSESNSYELAHLLEIIKRNF